MNKQTVFLILKTRFYAWACVCFFKIICLIDFEKFIANKSNRTEAESKNNVFGSEICVCVCAPALTTCAEIFVIAESRSHAGSYVV